MKNQSEVERGDRSKGILYWSVKLLNPYARRAPRNMRIQVTEDSRLGSHQLKGMELK